MDHHSHLKPDMFANVKIKSRITLNGIVVPEQAIIQSGDKFNAVVALGGGYFESREVTLGLRSEGFVEITAGLQEGEKLVTSSHFLIDSESNLQASMSQLSHHHEGAEAAEVTSPVAEHADHPASTTESDELKQAAQKEKELRQAGKKVYTCSMDPEVISDQPGDCPKCGMKLIEKVGEKPKAAADHAGHDMAKMTSAKSDSAKSPEQLENELRQTGKKVYTCSMDPEVISDKPGDCPKCGMKLKEKPSQN